MTEDEFARMLERERDRGRHAVDVLLLRARRRYWPMHHGIDPIEAETYGRIPDAAGYARAYARMHPLGDRDGA